MRVKKTQAGDSFLGPAGDGTYRGWLVQPFDDAYVLQSFFPDGSGWVWLKMQSAKYSISGAN